MGAPVQVTEQVLGRDSVHLNLSEMEQVKKGELQFRCQNRFWEGIQSILNPSEWSRSKSGSSSSGERTGFGRGYSPF